MKYVRQVALTTHDDRGMVLRRRGHGEPRRVVVVGVDETHRHST